MRNKNLRMNKRMRKRNNNNKMTSIENLIKLFKYLNIIFHESATGIAPGQSAVIYEGDDLIGGGFIDRKLPGM